MEKPWCRTEEVRSPPVTRGVTAVTPSIFGAITSHPACRPAIPVPTAIDRLLVGRVAMPIFFKGGQRAGSALLASSIALTKNGAKVATAHRAKGGDGLFLSETATVPERSTVHDGSIMAVGLLPAEILKAGDHSEENGDSASGRGIKRQTSIGPPDARLHCSRARRAGDGRSLERRIAFTSLISIISRVSVHSSALIHLRSGSRLPLPTEL